MTKIAGSGSIIQKHGSAGPDPDPHQNVMDPQHWFQDGNFDLADRSFHSLATSWRMVSHVSTSDVKELIPQLFYLPEMLENREGFALGKRQNGKVTETTY